MDKNSDNLEDLAKLLSNQVQGSDWLQTNTPEKWVSENKELYQEIQNEIKRTEEKKKT